MSLAARGRSGRPCAKKDTTSDTVLSVAEMGHPIRHLPWIVMTARAKVAAGDYVHLVFAKPTTTANNPFWGPTESPKNSPKTTDTKHLHNRRAAQPLSVHRTIIFLFCLLTRLGVCSSSFRSLFYFYTAARTDRHAPGRPGRGRAPRRLSAM